MNKKQIIERLYEIQKKYNDNVEEFHKDKEFIELASKIGNYKPKIWSAHKIVKKSR